MASNNLGPAPVTAREIGQAVGDVIASDMPPSSPANLQPVVDKIEALREDENAAATQASTQATLRHLMLNQIRDRANTTNGLLTQIRDALADGDEATTAELLGSILQALAQPFHVTVDNPAATTDLTALIAAVNAASDEAAVDKIELVRALLAGVIASGAVKVSGPLTDTQLRAVPLAVEIANDTGAAINVSGPVTNVELRATPLSVAPSRGALVDRSGKITAANTTQATAAVANTARTYLRVHNPDTVDLWVNYGAAASPTTAGSFRLFPGGSDTHDGFRIPTDAVHVWSTKADALFTIKEG